MEDFSRAHSKAVTDTALFMTADLRNRARADGWDKKVVNSLRVVHKDGEFSVRFPDSVADKAWVHEYGDPDTTPTATVRKYDTSPNSVAKFLNDRLSHHMKGGSK